MSTGSDDPVAELEAAAERLERLEADPPVDPDDVDTVANAYESVVRVDILGVEHALADDVAVERPVEAALVAGVAGAALLVDDVQQGVAVAVDADLLDALGVAAGAALLPELVAAARVVVGVPRLAGPLEGRPGDVREHQHVARVGVLGDGGNQPLFVEGEVDGHGRTWVARRDMPFRWSVKTARYRTYFRDRPNRCTSDAPVESDRRLDRDSSRYARQYQRVRGGGSGLTGANGEAVSE